MPTIEELRAAFLARGLEGTVWRWLEKSMSAFLHAAVPARFPAHWYAATGTWDDETLNDLLSDFVLAKCVEGNALLTALRLDSTADATRWLQAAMVNFVIDQRPRSVTANVYERLRTKVLPEHEALVAIPGHGLDTHYGLKSWTGPARPSFSAEMTRTALHAFPRDVHWVEYDTDQRESPGISSADLKRIALAVITATGAACSAAHLMVVITARIDFEERREISLDSPDPADRPRGRADILRLTDHGGAAPDWPAESFARKFIQGLTTRQIEICVRLLHGQGTDEIAGAVGVHSNTVGNEKRVLRARLAALPTRDEQLDVLRIIRSL